jgi:hypothetical protein
MDYPAPLGGPWLGSERSRRAIEQEGNNEMIRNFKTLGLSLVAVLALGALTASAASAVDVVTVGKSPALLTGVSHNNVFKQDPGNSKFECTTSKFAATVKNGDSLIHADVLYEGTLNQTPHEIHCNSNIGTVTIDMNGCEYTLSGETTGVDPKGSGNKDATIWITCPAGKTIQITSSVGATLSIPAQTPTKGGVTYTNVANHAGNSAVTVNATVTGITTTCAPAFACAIGGIPAHGNGFEYNGSVTMTAFEDKEGLPTPVTEGVRTSLSSS